MVSGSFRPITKSQLRRTASSLLLQVRGCTGSKRREHKGWGAVWRHKTSGRAISTEAFDGEKQASDLLAGFAAFTLQTVIGNQLSVRVPKTWFACASAGSTRVMFDSSGRAPERSVCRFAACIESTEGAEGQLRMTVEPSSGETETFIRGVSAAPFALHFYCGRRLSRLARCG
jgi:hypothetical protein